MVEAADILRFVDAAAERFRPERIVLFGSYAYGSPNEDSDVDVLVITERRGRAHDIATKIRQAVPINFAMDLIVYNQRTIERRIGWNDFFLKEVMEKGVVLFAADDPRVGQQGRRRLRRRLAATAIA
jgi:predicted nucleotidyltransferase